RRTGKYPGQCSVLPLIPRWQAPVQAASGPAVPLGQVASVQVTQGPPMIRTENAQLVNYIYVDMHDRDIGGYVADAQRALAQKISIPPRLPPRMERPVRISRTRESEARDRRAGHTRHHLRAPLPEFWPAHRNVDRDA